MGAPFAGLRGTGSFGTDERPKNFREMILWADPNGRAPFTALSAKMKTESTTDPEFAWWEETLKPRMVYINNGAGYDNNPATVTFTVDHGPGTHTDGYGNALTDTDLTANQFVPGDLLAIEKNNDPNTNEIVRVTTVNSATSITVARAVAGSTIASMTDNTRLTRVGSHYGEGSLSPNTVTSNPTKLVNYCEIQKTAFQVSNSAKATTFRTGDPMANDRKRKMFDHAEKHEMSAIFGRPSETTDANGMPLRTSGGLRYFLSSHVTTFTVDPTEDTFLNAVSGMFDFNANGAGNQRIAFIGNRALNFLNILVRNNTNVKINYDGKIDVYGMELMKWIIPQGEIAFKTHPLMNVHPQWSAAMLFVNPAGIVRRPLKGRDTKEEKNIQANDADYQKNQWIDEIGMEYHFEKTMGAIFGFYDH